MKTKLIISFLTFMMFSLVTAQTKKTLPKSTVIIPPKQVIRIDYPYMKGFSVKLWNKSKYELGVSSKEFVTDSIKKGFGLNKNSYATIQILENQYLQLENRYFVPLKVEYNLFKEGPGKKNKK